MNALLLAVVTVCLTMQTITKRIYNDKVTVDGKYCFSTIVALVALLFFVVTAGPLSFCIELLPYAVAFGLSYAVATTFCFAAIACGPLSITSLLISYSLLMPTLYGLIFLKEQADIGIIGGILLLVVSLYLICAKREKAKITGKWLLYTLLASVGNGTCSIVQKMQQDSFAGAYKNEFMIVALLLVTCVIGTIALVRERGALRACYKPGLLYGGGCGVANGIANLLVMVLANRLSASLLYPTISAGNIVLTYVISTLLFREKLVKRQLVGLFLGVAAVILLNL